MRVGIITFHFPYNYGAVIQAYAMQEHLRLMGHESYIIDYAPDYHTSRNCHGRTWKSCFADWKIHRIPFRIYYKLFNDPGRKRSENFDRFCKTHYHLYPYSKQDDMSFFDCVILGSDQIWNPKITNNRLDGPYYGEGFNCRVFSYAASNRTIALSDYEKEQYKKHLSNIEYIGVRESQLQTLLQQITDKKVYLNVDPTILADMSIYNMLNLSRPLNEKYVVVYEIDNHVEVQRMAEKYANAIDAKTVILVSYVSTKYGRKFDQAADPEKFLAYIYNAECVFTTSFHGTALSLVFNKEFFSFKQGNSADLRIESLLSLVGLESRFVSMDAPFDNNPINYLEVSKKLAQIKRDSQAYLEGALLGTL